MAKAPEERYQSMNELVAAMTEVFRLFVGPRATGMMAAAPISTSQFVPVPSTYMPAYKGTGPMEAPAFPEAPKKKSSMLVPVALFALLGLGGGGGAAWWFLVGPGSKKAIAEAPEAPTLPQAPPPEMPKVPEIKVVIPETPKPEPETPKPEPPKPEPPKPDAPKPVTPKPVVPKPEPWQPQRPEPKKQVDVVVDSYPRGADIYRDGNKVGETPDSVSVTEGDSVTLTLKMTGYHDGTLKLDGSERKVQKKLKKIRDESETGEIKGWGEVSGEDKEKEKEKMENPDGLE
jgi:hypothetical protein